jgi:putative tryptophan/tyrosine transport system substrate-binding protein
MRRRAFIAGLGATAAWPMAALAQQRTSSSKRLGVLTTADDAEWQAESKALLEELKKRGWANPENLQIDYRFGGGNIDAISTAARDLVNLQPDVILARSTPVVRALLLETRTIPIVFISASDPIGEKFAATFARPGGNVTGFTNIEASMSAKWLELLKDVVPEIQNVAVLYNPQMAVLGGAFFLQEIQAAAPSFAVKLHAIPVHSSAEIQAALERLSKEPGAALVVAPDQFIVANRSLIIELAARHRLPAIYAFRNMAVEGGLMSYGTNLVDLYRRSTEIYRSNSEGGLGGRLANSGPNGFRADCKSQNGTCNGPVHSTTILAARRRGD